MAFDTRGRLVFTKRQHLLAPYGRSSCHFILISPAPLITYCLQRAGTSTLLVGFLLHTWLTCSVSSDPAQDPDLPGGHAPADGRGHAAAGAAAVCSAGAVLHVPLGRNHGGAAVPRHHTVRPPPAELCLLTSWMEELKGESVLLAVSGCSACGRTGVSPT